MVTVAPKHGRFGLTEASVRTFPLAVSLPPGMTVESVYGVLIDLEPCSDVAEVVAACRWQYQPPVAPDPQSGEDLDAQSWAFDGHVVMLGTEDGDALSRRLLNCGLADGPYPVCYLPDGIEIVLPTIAARTRTTLQFVVAANPHPEPVQDSVWFAVDVTHTALIAVASES